MGGTRLRILFVLAAGAAFIAACRTSLDIDTPRLITVPTDTASVYSDARAFSMVIVDSTIAVSDVPKWFCDGGLPQNTFARIDTLPNQVGS